MVFDASVALTWILFLALFPMSFIWLRRAWKIFLKRDYSEVALKGGEPPANPKKYAPVAGLINLIAGLVALWIIVGVPTWIASGILLGPFRSYGDWSAIAGVTIWFKIFADFILSRQAHPFTLGKKKKKQHL